MGEEKYRQKRRRLEEAVRKVEVGRREGRQRCSKGEVEGEKKAMRGRGGVGNGSKSTLTLLLPPSCRNPPVSFVLLSFALATS